MRKTARTLQNESDVSPWTKMFVRKSAIAEFRDGNKKTRLDFLMMSPSNKDDTDHRETSC